MLKLDITQRLDFDPTSASEALAAGTQIDRYQLLETVSEDELGIVYRALDLKLQCEVAVKEYLPHCIAARGDSTGIEPRGAVIAEAFKAGVRAFAEDAKALRLLQIRSVVRVLRVWHANGTAYRAMPWLEGATLASRLHTESAAGGRAPSTLLATVLEPLLQGVQAIHQHGHLHGRLSPSNVFITSESTVVLFGFRAKAESIAEASWSEYDAATEACRPIELVPGRLPDTSIGSPGAWSDVYSLGALMHLMISGKLPSPAIKRLIDDDHRPLGDESRPGCDANLLRAADWALGVLPERRPHDIAQMKRRLLAERSDATEHAKHLSALANGPQDTLRLHVVPESTAPGQGPDFVTTRPMVFEDEDEDEDIPTEAVAHAVVHAVAHDAVAHEPVESTATPEPEPPAASPPPPAPEPASPATAPEPIVDILKPSAPAPLDEAAFNSKPSFLRGPETARAETPPPPIAKPEREREPAPEPITRRARWTTTTAVLFCLLLLGGLAWWLLDPWLRPTLGSSSLGLHAPAAATAAPAPATRPAAGDSAPVDLGSSKAAALPPAVPKAMPAPTPVVSAHRTPADPPRTLPPPTHQRANARCSDLLSKQSLGVAPDSRKPTDPGCQ